MEFLTLPAPTPYEETITAMESHVASIIAGSAEEQVWLVEHPPLYTGGTSADNNDLIQPPFPVYHTGRGGQYTYHGPGQRVAYAMLNLKHQHQDAPDLKHYVWQLEEWIIRTLKKFSIVGERRDGRVGIWVADNNTGKENKIAAIGIRVRKWITFHGIAINVNPNLQHFAGIVPCGIREHGVTSMHALGKMVTMEALDQALTETFNKIFLT